MKTVRTVLATLAGVLLAYSLTAWISVRADAAFVQRTIYQGFDQTFIIALVMGGAFLLITVILSVAIASASAEGEDFEEEEDEEPLEDEEEELPKPAPKKTADKGAGYRRPAHMPQKNLEEVLEEEQIVFAKPAQSEVKPEPKPEVKPEPKPEPAPEAKPEPKPEPVPEAKPEVKPAPKPQEEGFIHCIYCGKKVSANSAFCPQCGKKL